MQPREDHQDSLLRFAVQMSNALSDCSRSTFRDIATEVMEAIGRQTGAHNVHLLLVKRSSAVETTASAFAEWSQVPVAHISAQLQDVPLRFLGTEALKTLRSGSTFFSAFDERKNACSKLVSGLLRELGLNSYEMLPVMSKDRMVAILGIAHSAESEFLNDNDRQLIRVVGSSLVQSIQFAKRERIRKRVHRQWKSVANGACDFALRVDSRLEITGVIAFRQTKPPQIEGLLLTEFVAHGSCDSVLESIHAALRDSEPRSLQFLAINASGRPCSYAGRVEIASPKSRKCDLTLYLTNNDTERAHAEELLGLRDQLDRATRLSLLGNIATEFAHQLTQPLQAVSNHLYTLSSRVRRNEPVEAILSCVANIEKSIDHAGAIIKNLRAFVTNRQVVLEPVKLLTLVDHAVTMVEIQSERIGVKIHIDKSSGLLENEMSPLVQVDGVQTTHVIINLLINALEAFGEAHTESPRITISAQLNEKDGEVLVEVSDNGPGLSRDDPESVFERFFTTKSEGFGIGLAICRDVIERQHGTIHARNNADRGCCFSFTLKLSDSQEPATDDEDDDQGLDSDTQESN